MNDPGHLLEQVFRSEYGLVLASLTRTFGDFDLAEEALAEAISSAVETWTERGVPENPAAWLVTVARRKGIDRLRRQKALEARLPRLVEPSEVAIEADPDSIPDDRLGLLFACCHPALSVEAQVALTLKSLGGLSTPEIARAFLTTESTMLQRITRARKKIRLAGIPIEMPGPEDLPDRLGSVLAVIYLIFNEGYLAAKGPDLVRVDLCREAIRLADMLAVLMPEEAEVWGLGALCWLTEARRPARSDDGDELVLLEDQDRTLWDPMAISSGLTCLERARALGPAGEYVIQAEIAAIHTTAPSWIETDWGSLARWYQRLLSLKPSPVVALNLAAVIGLAEGPEAGLALMETLDGSLEDYQPYHAARAELLARAGRHGEACAGFRRALELPGNDVQRRHLEGRLARETDLSDTMD